MRVQGETGNIKCLHFSTCFSGDHMFKCYTVDFWMLINGCRLQCIGHIIAGLMWKWLMLFKIILAQNRDIVVASDYMQRNIIFTL
jgi:hypothetical protein